MILLRFQSRPVLCSFGGRPWFWCRLNQQRLRFILIPNFTINLQEIKQLRSPKHTHLFVGNEGKKYCLFSACIDCFALTVLGFISCEFWKSNPWSELLSFFFPISFRRLRKMSSFDSYQALRKAKSNTTELLRWHFTTILEGIYRRLVTKEKFKDPWEIRVKLSVHRSVFLEFYKAVRDHVTSYGRTTTSTKGKAGKIKTYQIEFEKLASFVRHVSLIFQHAESEGQIKVNGYLKRTWDSSGSTATVICSADKPIKVQYSTVKSKLTVQIKYEVTNKYGETCSYWQFCSSTTEHFIPVNE